MVGAAYYSDTATASTWPFLYETCGNTDASTCSSDHMYHYTWHNWTTSASNTVGILYYRPDNAPEPIRRSDWVRPTPTRVEARPEDADEKARRAAERLLFAHLTEEQKAMYRRLRRFRVVGSDGEVYEVDATKRQHNVFLLDQQNRRTQEFCIYQGGRTPLADNHLGQKLLVEADAVLFKKIANSRLLAVS